MQHVHGVGGQLQTVHWSTDSLSIVMETTSTATKTPPLCSALKSPATQHVDRSMDFKWNAKRYTVHHLNLTLHLFKGLFKHLAACHVVQISPLLCFLGLIHSWAHSTGALPKYRLGVGAEYRTLWPGCTSHYLVCEFIIHWPGLGKQLVQIWASVCVSHSAFLCVHSHLVSLHPQILKCPASYFSLNVHDHNSRK